MLGQALALTALLLLQGHQGQELLGPTEHVALLSGHLLRLQPPSTQTGWHSVEWKVQLWSQPQSQPQPQTHVILSWVNGSVWNGSVWNQNIFEHFSNRVDFKTEDLTLLINRTQKQDSGLYFLEVTDEAGRVHRQEFQVSVFDPVGPPHLLPQWEVWDGGLCRLTLSCSVSGSNGLSYAWYKGSERIQMLGNLTQLHELMDARDSRSYTCNVSNPVSWANHTLRLTQGCWSALQQFGFLPFGMILTFVISVLFLGTLTWLCVRSRKRRPSQLNPEEVLPVYEDVNSLRIRRKQDRREEQSPAGGASTIYSRIQPQPPASTPQENANTLYSVVQHARHAGKERGSESDLEVKHFLPPNFQPGPKKRNHSPPSSGTVYEEVGQREPGPRTLLA